MSGYGFGRKPVKETGAGSGEGAAATEPDRLDLSGIVRAPVPLDPKREEAAIQRGDALGFVDRGMPAESPEDAGPRRRRRSAQPQVSVFIKGPKDTLDWFVEYTNQRGHRSYWETLEELRALVERT
jgi:hypothetical protein